MSPHQEFSKAQIWRFKWLKWNWADKIDRLVNGGNMCALEYSSCLHVIISRAFLASAGPSSIMLIMSLDSPLLLLLNGSSKCSLDLATSMVLSVSKFSSLFTWRALALLHKTFTYTSYIMYRSVPINASLRFSNHTNGATIILAAWVDNWLLTEYSK